MMPPSANIPPATGLRSRILALTPRERRFLAAGALVLLLFVIYLLWPSEDDQVELAEAPPPAAPPAYVPPPPVATPMPAPPALAQADPSSAAGLVLRGVMGGGPSGGAAIIAFPDGSQRVVRVGRELIPGMTLRSIGVNHAIASSRGGDLRLELNRAGATPVAMAPPAPAPPVSTGVPRVEPEAALQYRLGLAPQKSNGRIQGFAIRPGARLPMLEQAGLRPGDVLVAINGQAVESEEKVLELPQEIAGSYTADFEFIRGGKRMKASTEVNPRPGR